MPRYFHYHPLPVVPVGDTNRSPAPVAIRISWPRSTKRSKLVTSDLLAQILSSVVAADFLVLIDKHVAYAAFDDESETRRAIDAVAAAAPPELRGLRLHCALWGSTELAHADAECATSYETTSAIPLSVPYNAVPEIPGLMVIHNFITAEEEQALLSCIDTQPWVEHLTKRRVQHYGTGFDYISRQTNTAATPVTESSLVEGSCAETTCGQLGPLYSFLSQIARHRYCGDAGDGSIASAPDPVPLSAPAISVDATDLTASALFPTQVTVNEYRKGEGIASHVDTHAGFEDGVVSLSLGADTVMEFTYAAAATAALEAGAGTTGETLGLSSLHPQPPALQQCLVCLPRRSLLVLRGEARFAWAHSIASRLTDTVDGHVVQRGDRRVSVTARLARSPFNPCRCAWPSVCFSQNGMPSTPSQLLSPRLSQRQNELRRTAPPSADIDATPSLGDGNAGREHQPAHGVSAVSRDAPSGSPSRSRDDAPPDSAAPPCGASLPPPLAGEGASAVRRTPAIEARHVHSVYDSIAEHFSHTRHSPWPRVQAFLDTLPMGSVLLDVGCGNAKYLTALRSPPRVAAVGCDRSAALMDIVGQRGCEGAVADAVCLPYRDGVADAVLCVAVLHHISTVERRLALIGELIRVARPRGGRVFLQAWAREQGADSKRSFGGAEDALVPWCLQRKFVSADEASVSAAGGVLDASRHAVVFQRYIHAYSEGELESLIAQVVADSGAPTAGAVPPCRVQVLERWWDRDNWCVVFERCE